MKIWHEVRDPIHVFVHLDPHEVRVLNSLAVQRLRHIHQLALSYLVYPSSTHTRFEHSLGVMELSDRIFGVVTRHIDKLSDQVRELLPETARPNELAYWRSVLRMAALCHDVGHLPFSHAAEKELLPDGWNHERLTREIILSPEMRAIWATMVPPPTPEHIARIAVGPQTAGERPLTNWESILSEIIVGDALGADRIDYLIRDSHHTGVAYGKFDHYRLIDSLRILISPSTNEPALGTEEGGLQSAEALLWARYLIYSQVYLHPIRRIYDIHLRDFLSAWLKDGKFSVDIPSHIRMTDNEVMAAIFVAASDKTKAGHDPARRIVHREHFRVLYARNPADMEKNLEASLAVFEATAKQFGPEFVRRDEYTQKGGSPDFPVLLRGGQVVSSVQVSEPLTKLPVAAIDYVYIAPEKRDEAARWLQSKLPEILEKGKRKHE